ncbi:MAG: hypothetical protein EOQ53_17550 [Mesorhizobium sp.]|nr:MAG: hypothetical protein EOQ53_17550 [Mesorhizobium sp.]
MPESGDGKGKTGGGGSCRYGSAPQEFFGEHGAAPHPDPLPVKDGERGASALEFVPSPRLSREEGAGRRMRGSAIAMFVIASVGILTPP